MHIMYINILPMILNMESDGQVHVRESSGLCFITEISNTELFEKLILVHFGASEK
jgi:hypothetical protein